MTSYLIELGHQAFIFAFALAFVVIVNKIIAK
jgi:hypothetical protein